jgi:hypothetical protein
MISRGQNNYSFSGDQPRHIGVEVLTFQRLSSAEKYVTDNDYQWHYSLMVETVTTSVTLDSYSALMLLTAREDFIANNITTFTLSPCFSSLSHNGLGESPAPASNIVLHLLWPSDFYFEAYQKRHNRRVTSWGCLISAPALVVEKTTASWTKTLSRNRPWRPIGLWDVEALTFSRQSAQRWRWGCKPREPAALYP